MRKWPHLDGQASDPSRKRLGEEGGRSRSLPPRRVRDNTGVRNRLFRRRSGNRVPMLAGGRAPGRAGINSARPYRGDDARLEAGATKWRRKVAGTRGRDSACASPIGRDVAHTQPGFLATLGMTASSRVLLEPLRARSIGPYERKKQRAGLKPGLYIGDTLRGTPGVSCSKVGIYKNGLKMWIFRPCGRGLPCPGNSTLSRCKTSS
jgi:hypothetical protein